MNAMWILKDIYIFKNITSFIYCLNNKHQYYNKADRCKCVYTYVSHSEITYTKKNNGNIDNKI